LDYCLYRALLLLLQLSSRHMYLFGLSGLVQTNYAK